MISIVFIPATGYAQSPSECSSIEQSSDHAPVIEGYMPPANVLTRLIDDNNFLIEINANPSFTISFIQVIYTDTIGTSILMPGPQSLPPADITSSWQAEINGKFNYYKVMGCRALHASTSTSEAYVPTTLPGTTMACSPDENVVWCKEKDQADDTTSLKVSSNVAIPVNKTPAYTG